MFLYQHKFKPTVKISVSETFRGCEVMMSWPRYATGSGFDTAVDLIRTEERCEVTDVLTPPLQLLMDFLLWGGTKSTRYCGHFVTSSLFGPNILLNTLITTNATYIYIMKTLVAV
jgi:hypothetical protein